MKSVYRKNKITYDIVGNEHYIMKRMHRNKNVQWITKGMHDKTSYNEKCTTHNFKCVYHII